MLSRDVRALADRRPARRVLRAAQAHRDRPVRRAATRSRCRRAGRDWREAPVIPLQRALAELSGATPRARGARGRRARDGSASRSRLAIGFSAVELTRLPDVVPRSQAPGAGSGRSVAVGTFDGVHLGHRAVIEGSDSVLTFDPHPVAVVAPQHTPEAADHARGQGGTDRRARGGGADRDPLRRGLRRALGGGLRRERARRRARRPAGSDRGELSLRTSGAGRPAAAGCGSAL